MGSAILSCAQEMETVNQWKIVMSATKIDVLWKKKIIWSNAPQTGNGLSLSIYTFYGINSSLEPEDKLCTGLLFKPLTPETFLAESTPLMPHFSLDTAVI